MEFVIGLLLVGILLLFIEIFLTPGSTAFGAIGLCLILGSCFLSFQHLNAPYNWLYLLLTSAIVCFFLYVFYNLLKSKKFSVQSEITAKVNVLEENRFLVGEKGITLTALRPNGRAEFQGHIVDVFSEIGYIEENTTIEITDRTNDRIYVQQIEN